ncbi:MAG: Water stress and hypersensitive response domain-containing protein [Betaproteobacteria bacterium]|nr:MAG: Water stress and hypersensitive response domain-containing protein [Betaproteobacteria bacterium]
MIVRSLKALVVCAALLGLGGCASLQGGDPLQVTVAGVESLPGEGMELRMLVKLRVQNPNDTPFEYDGVYVKLDVQEKAFATGVSDARGSVPRFGETIIAVPVTVSVLRMVRHAMGFLDGKAIDKIRYDMEGKLSGPVLGARQFQSQGELVLPVAGARRSNP